jgi:hypothetical protein
MSSIQTFSRLALKQFCALLEGVDRTESSTGDLECELWTKIQAGNPDVESIRVPYPMLKKVLRKFKVELPYMPKIINYNIGCSALKVSGGLYLPCCGKCEEESAYCSACSKQELKYGVLEDRGDVGTYSDPSDKHEISFGTWLAKNEKTIDEVSEALASEGFVVSIPSHHLTVNSKRIVKDVKARKGRPKAAKKEVTGDDSDSGSDAEMPEKVKKPKAEKSKKTKSPKDSDDSDSEKPVKVKKPKAEKSKGSDDSDSEKPVKVKKPKAEKSKGSDDSDSEKPVKVKKPKAEKSKGSDADSDSEKPKKPKAEKSKKIKSPEGSDDEAPVIESPKAEKSKKIKSPKGSDADSDAEKPKKLEAEKTNSPKSPEPDVADKWEKLVYGDEKKVEKSKKTKSSKGSDDEAPVKKEKKAKSGEEKSEKKEKKAKSGEKDKKEKKAKSGEEKSDKKAKSGETSDMSARFSASTELSVEEYSDAMDDKHEVVEVDGVAYHLRDGNVLADTETGQIVGRMEEGKGILDDGNESDW